MRKQTTLLLLLLALKFALPFFLQHPVYELHRDEYLYYEQGAHLSLGYLENPPLIGLLAALSRLLGGSAFWIKFWPALFGAGTLWLVFRMVKEFGGGLYAQVLAGIGMLFTAFLRIHFLFQPNFLDVFSWTLGFYFLLRFLNTSAPRYLFLLALAVVLGWYGKYSVLFFAAAVFLALLLSHHRTVFLRRPFWLAVAIGALLVVPNLLWQYSHHWPLVHHMKELQETQLQYRNNTDFLKEQILMLFPVVFVWLGGLVWLLRQRRFRVIGYSFLFIITLIMLGSGKGYYTLGAFPVALAAGGVWAERLSVRKPWLRYAFATLVLLLSLPFVPVLVAMQGPEEMAVSNKKYGLQKLGLLKWEDGENHLLQQDFADMLGWKELAQKAEAYYRRLPDSARASAIVYCRNYGLAGGLKYYAADDSFRNKIISDNGTFLLWIPERLYFRDLLFLGYEMPGKDDAVFQQFERATVVDSCTNPYSRQYGYKLIHFQNAHDSAWKLAQAGLREMKADFGQ